VLRWVVCAERPLSLAELVEAVAIDEMGNTWDPQRVVTEGLVLVDSCTNLLVTHDGQTNRGVKGLVVQLIHASVHDFLTSDPKLFDTTLPQYHVYPLQQAHIHTAKDCFRYFTSLSRDDESHPLCDYAVSSWTVHAEASGAADQLLASLFQNDISGESTGARGGHYNPVIPDDSQEVVFPNATHATAIGCKFNFVHGTQYNVFSTSTDAHSIFGKLSFMDMFPNLVSLDARNCAFFNTTANQNNIYRYPVTADFGLAQVSSTDFRRATHVTFVNFTFNLVTGTQYHIFPPCSAIISRIRPPSDDPMFKPLNIFQSESSTFTNVGGMMFGRIDNFEATNSIYENTSSSHHTNIPKSPANTVVPMFQSVHTFKAPNNTFHNRDWPQRNTNVFTLPIDYELSFQ
jgi:hypothetical protein